MNRSWPRRIGRTFLNLDPALLRSGRLDRKIWAPSSIWESKNTNLACSPHLLQCLDFSLKPLKVICSLRKVYLYCLAGVIQIHSRTMNVHPDRLSTLKSRRAGPMASVVLSRKLFAWKLACLRCGVMQPRFELVSFPTPNLPDITIVSSETLIAWICSLTT